VEEISSFDQIIALAKERNLYVRWSRGPELDKRQRYSRDHASGNLHRGLSCQRIDPREQSRKLIALMLVEYRYLRTKDSRIRGWVFTGTSVGRDSDNAPLVDAESIKTIGWLSEDLVEALCAYSGDYWDWRRDGPRSWSDVDDYYNREPKLEEYLI